MTLSRDVEAIRALISQVEAAYATGDPGYVDLYTADPVVLYPGLPMMTRKEELLHLWNESAQQFDARMTMDTEEVIVSGDWAFARNSTRLELTPRAGGATQEIRGRNLLILQRQEEGAWKLARVMVNHESAAAGSALSSSRPADS